jgi:transcriptional regulator with XRE-family HTH domain
MDYTYIGKQIRHYRRLKGMSQSDLGLAVGISAAHVGHLERGSRRASLETMVAISRKLQTSLDSLIFPDAQEIAPQIGSMQQLYDVLTEARDITARLLTEDAAD